MSGKYLKSDGKDPDIENLEAEIVLLRATLIETQKECEEQARLNGMGSSREARLMAQLAEAQERAQLPDFKTLAEEFYKAWWEHPIEHLPLSMRTELVECMKRSWDALRGAKEKP